MGKDATLRKAVVSRIIGDPFGKDAEFKNLVNELRNHEALALTMELSDSGLGRKLNAELF